MAAGDNLRSRANGGSRPIPISRPASFLTFLVVTCATAASLVTLGWRNSFPSSSPAPVVNVLLAEARGWSAATLFVTVPLSCLALVAGRRGSLRGRLAWIGTLAYFVYTYLELAVSPPFTALYLVYVTAFACAIPALVMGVASIDVDELPRLFGARAPRRSVAAFSLLFATLLGLAWLESVASTTLAGAFGWPVGEAAVGHVVHALDLGLQVPLGIAAGILLLRRKAAGDLVAAIFLINGVCIGAALAAMVASAAAASGESVWRAAPFAVVWAIGAALALTFFRSDSGAGSVTRSSVASRDVPARGPLSDKNPVPASPRPVGRSG
jgi:hypothetical protein